MRRDPLTGAATCATSKRGLAACGGGVGSRSAVDAPAQVASPTPPPPLPTPSPAVSCTNLPAAGTSRSVTPAGNGPGEVNGPVGAAVIFDPLLPHRLWLGTGFEDDEIWRPDEGGGSWTRVNTGPGSVEVGAQWSMAVDFTVPNTLYAVSGDGAQNLWKSTHGGIR